MVYKLSYTFSDEQKGDRPMVDYAESKQEVIDDLRNVCEKYHLASACVFNINDTIDVKLEGNRWNVIGKAVPLKATMSRLSELKEGDVFRFMYEENRFRTVQQVGKTELYAPYHGQDTMGHSMGGGDEVFSRSFTAVILYTEK